MGDETNESFNITKLCESINQGQQVSAISGINIPEFGGLPGEDVIEFLNRFKTATFILSDELKCVALKKAFVNPARIWAKDNLKEIIATGDWKSAKKAILARFEAADYQERYHQKLANMRYDPKAINLRSYIESYAACFKKAHKTADDKSIIESLVQNLPNNIKHTLNLLSETWRNMKSLSDLYPVIKRAEQEILPYAPKDQEPAERLDVTTMAKMLKQMQDEFKKDCLEKIKAETKASSEEAIAAIGRFQAQQPPVSRPYPRNDGRNPFQTSYNRSNNYNATRPPRRDFTQMDNNDQSQQRRPPQPMLANQLNFGQDNRFNGSRPNTQELKAAYEAKFGPPPGPCHYCGQHHFNRHCPYTNFDLK